MSRRFVGQDEAARMLGVTADELTVMRERHDISAYRDGVTWKFRADDVERLVAERQAEGGDALHLEADAEPPPVDEGESILLSELSLGESGAGTASTIIGKPGSKVPADESDIRLASAAPPKKDDSDIKLASDKGPASDLKLGTGSSGAIKAAGLGSLTDPGLAKGDELRDDLDGLDLGLEHSGGDLDVGPSSLKLVGSDFNLDLEKPAAEEGATLIGGSQLKASAAGGSKISLDDLDSDDDLVLGGEAPGSDVTIKPGDSGISLLNPGADSGLSLDDPPLELASSVAQSMDLGGGDEADFSLGDAAEGELKSDDEFLLTPLQDSIEESDSGSQVIALDSDESFGDLSGAVQLDTAPGAVALEEDVDAAMAGVGAAAGVGMVGTGAAMPTLAASVAQFSAANIVFLGLCVIMLALAGMMSFDLLRNMWSWEGPYYVNSGLMDAIVKVFGK